MTTKERVLEAALTLFLDHGFHGTSIKLIVDKSGVSTGSVYHHFSNKEEILKELYYLTKIHMNSHVLAELKYDKGIREILATYWVARIHYNIKYPQKADLVRQYFNSDKVESEKTLISNKMYDEFIQAVLNAMENKEVQVLDPHFFFYDLFHACDVVTYYTRSRKVPLTDEFIEMTFRKYWRSIVDLNLY